jgi:hypothetical protein
MWDMESLLECGTIAEQRNAESKLGVKEKPWWSDANAMQVQRYTVHK